MPRRPPVQPPLYDKDYVRRISLDVYRKGFTEDELHKIDHDPKKGHEWFYRNSKAYNKLTRQYLDTINALGLQQRKEKV